MQDYYHAVARTRHQSVPFKDLNSARKFWNLIGNHFPSASAVCIMPNHLHLITQGEPKEISDQLQMTLHLTSKSLLLGSGVFEAVPTPRLIPDQHQLLRQIRYVHLNPCRAKLVTDPLSWEFSTHRDALGLRYVGKEKVRKLVHQLGFTSAGFHKYVSSDPTVNVQGTSVPVALPQSRLRPQVGIPVLVDAVRSVLGLEDPSAPQFRLLLLALLLDQGFTQSSILQKELGVSRQHVFRLKQRLPLKNEIMQLLRYYAADARLRALM
jgi:REP element-mobilizing transposase RayT